MSVMACGYIVKINAIQHAIRTAKTVKFKVGKKAAANIAIFIHDFLAENKINWVQQFNK